MWGPSIMVAPITDNTTSREMYLPGNEWYAFYDGEKV